MKYTALLFLILLVSALRAQVVVGGLIRDSLAAPVPFCAAGLINAKDSSIVKGTLSDENGRFRFESILPGTYFIKINHPGFSEFRSVTFSLDSISGKELEPMILKSSGINLNEVDIVDMKEPIEFKNGNITVNIDGSPLAAGNSVYDLLARLPGVSVYNDVISLQGKSGVKIYIDDRPQQMSGAQLINLLKSLSASTIEKIEVINNPPSKYDAAGDAGIINIRTKKVKLVGFSGNATLSYSQGFYENSNGSFSLNYKGRKFTFFSNITGNQGMRHNLTTFDKAVNYNGLSTQFNQRLTDDYDNRTTVTDVGVDWSPDKKNIIGAKMRVLAGYGLNKDRGITALSDTSLGYNKLVLEKSLPNDWFMLNYNLNTEHAFDTLGTKLKFSADYYNPNYDNYKGTYSNSFLNTENNSALPAQEFHSNNRLGLKIFIGRLDFEKKLSKTLSMEAGLKASYQDISSNYIFERKNEQSGGYVVDPGFTNTFNYLEKISAAYFNFSKEIKKLNFQFGLRGENTQIRTGNADNTISYTRNYSNLFPTVSVDYNRSKDHIFSIAYNKRIGRPDYTTFNPYKSFVDVLNSYQGNPYIKQMYIHNFNFNYALKSSIYNSLSYSRMINPISGYFSQNDSTKETVQKITNLNYFEVLRYSLFIKKEIKKWWTLSFNFGAYYVGYGGKLDGQNYSTAAVPCYAWMSNMFLLPKDVKMEITSYYWSPWLGIANKYKTRAALSLAVKKSLFKNTLNCSLAINDLFFSETLRYTADYQNQNWQRFESYDTRRLNISLSYNFGKIKIEKRDVDPEETENVKLKK